MGVIYIYMCVCVRVFSKGVACTNPVQPELLGLKVTSATSSLGLPWGKGRGSWGASWFVEGLVTELWWARGSWGFTRLRFLARPLCGAGQVERRKKGRQAEEEERSKEKGNSSQRSRGTWDPVLPGWSLGESPFEVRNGRIGGKSHTWFGPWRRLAERQLWKRHDGQKGGQDKAIIKASNLPALDACYQC